MMKSTVFFLYFLLLPNVNAESSDTPFLDMITESENLSIEAVTDFLEYACTENKNESAVACNLYAELVQETIHADLSVLGESSLVHIKLLMIHLFSHNLGMRHNFSGSAALSQSIGDLSYSTVMDYFFEEDDQLSE